MAIDARTFETIKSKIEVLKSKRAKAEGAIESEMSQWAKVYKVETREELESKLDEATKELETIETKMGTHMNELKELTNWSLV